MHRRGKILNQSEKVQKYNGDHKQGQLNLQTPQNGEDGKHAAGSVINFLMLGYGALVLVTIAVLGYVLLNTDAEEGGGSPRVKTAEIPDFSYAKNAPEDIGDLTAIISGEEVADINVALKNIDRVLPKSNNENAASVNTGKIATDIATANNRIAVKSASIINALAPVTWRNNENLWSDVANTAPKIVIVIDDMGIVERASEAMGKMKGPFTLAYLPYADHLERQVEAVREANHELIIHMPMEPKDASVDPGSNALLSSLNAQELNERLNWNMNRFRGFVGVNNHMGSLLTERADVMVQIMAILKHNNLLFLDSVTTPKTVGASAAKAVGVPYASRDIFLDNVKDKNAIKAQLRKVEAIAKKRGYAIAIGHPYDETMAVLKEWRGKLEERGFQLVPLSQVVFERESRLRLAGVSSSGN